MKKLAFVKMPTFTDTNAVDVLTVVALVISYSKLVDLALRAGYFEPIAYAWPLIVDGLALVATRATRSLTGKAHAYAWVLLVGATLVSIVAACASALLPAGPLPGEAAAAVFVVTPIFLLAAQHLAQLMRDAVAELATAEGQGDAPTADAVPRTTDATQDRAAAPHTEESDAPAPVDAPDAVLFDLKRDASARRTRRGGVTAEQRAKVLRLAATTDMSGRDIGDAAGTSEPSVRRILLAVGGRDALRARATHDLAAAGG